MKQLIVGLGVLALFVAYSLGIRHEQPAVTKPIAVAPVRSIGHDDTAKPTKPKTSDTIDRAPKQPIHTNTGQYKNGTSVGSVEDAFYGDLQVAAIIAGGKLTDITFLVYPNTHTDSVMINQQAMPLLRQEAIQKQQANVDVISGATFTSQAFIQSLSSALSNAKNV